jgi:hypothetical protein
MRAWPWLLGRVSLPCAWVKRSVSPYHSLRERFRGPALFDLIASRLSYTMMMMMMMMMTMMMMSRRRIVTR